MAIKPLKGEGIDILLDAVPKLIAAHRSTEGKDVRGALGGGEPLSLGGPHFVYSLSLDDARKPRLLDRAKIVGQRYLVLQGNEAVATAQLAGAPSKPRLSHVNFGKLASAMTEAIRIAEQLPEVQQDDFDLRLLEIPPLFMFALWLKGTAKSIFVPLAPSPSSRLEPNRSYTAEEFVSGVRELALERIQGKKSLRVDMVDRDKVPS